MGSSDGLLWTYFIRLGILISPRRTAIQPPSTATALLGTYHRPQSSVVSLDAPQGHWPRTNKPTSPWESSPIPHATTLTTINPEPSSQKSFQFVCFLILMDKHHKGMRITRPRTSNHGFDFTLPFSISVRGLIMDLIFSGQGRRGSVDPRKTR